MLILRCERCGTEHEITLNDAKALTQTEFGPECVAVRETLLASLDDHNAALRTKVLERWKSDPQSVPDFTKTDEAADVIIARK